jgi:sterol 14-demethylase
VRIKVDRDLCQGHGVCRTEAPEIFDVDREIEQVIVKDEQPPESLREKVVAAVRYCPTRALSIEEE